MHHFTTALCAGLMATVVVGGAAFTPTPAEAARTSSAEAVALKEATVACKAEAKGKKLWWPASRKYVKNCVTTTLKDHKNMNISDVRRGVNVKGLRMHQRPEWGCEGMTSGRTTGC
jgi:hypothetical protein